MTRWVMLLRGINVGGTGKLRMADLRALLETLGARHVATYIQSGNAVFSALLDATAFEAIVTDEIRAAYGFAPRTLLITGDRFREIVAAYPFSEARARPKPAAAAGTRPGSGPKTGHVWFLAGAPSPDRTAMDALAAPGERFEITESAFYLYAPDGIGRSKLAERAETLLGVAATARNLNTCARIVDMLDLPAED